MSGNEPSLSFDQVLDAALSAARDGRARAPTLWDSTIEELEKTCANHPEIFGARCSMAPERLNAIYASDERPPVTDEHDATMPGELALRLKAAATLSEDELHQLRRDLALWHHPDRHRPEHRPVTDEVMKTINSMIDSEISKRRANHLEI